jgi:hypothetical protein
MKSFIFAYFLLAANCGFTQLKCKTLKGRFGDSTVCFHENKSVSTIDYPDREADSYKHFLAYDNKGNKIFEGGHGYRHGGGSLDVKYYDNGCISSVRSTFQPDGGIQHYDVTAYFNEDGSFNRREDNSWDKQVTYFTYTTPTTETPVNNPIQKVDSVNYILKNSSGKKLKILVSSLKDPALKEVIVLRNNKERTLGVFERLQKKNGVYEHLRIDVLPEKNKFRTIIVSDDQLTSNEKEYLVIVHID